MNTCRRCGTEHNNGTGLCDIHRQEKKQYDKRYNDKPKIKEKRLQSRIIRRTASKELTPKEHQLYDQLVETLFKHTL